MKLLYGNSDQTDLRFIPPVTRLQCVLNNMIRTQRDLARFHQEVRQILAAHPELHSYVASEFKQPRLIVDNVPHRRGKSSFYRARKSLDDKGHGPEAA